MTAMAMIMIIRYSSSLSNTNDKNMFSNTGLGFHFPLLDSQTSTPNDSNGSIGSDHPTIIDSDEVLSPGLADPEKEEEGIMEEQMKMDNTSTSSNLSVSGGSDSGK